MTDLTNEEKAQMDRETPALAIADETAEQLLIGAPKYRPRKPARVQALKMVQSFRLTEIPEDAMEGIGEAGDYLVLTPAGLAVIPGLQFETEFVKIERQTKK